MDFLTKLVYVPKFHFKEVWRKARQGKTGICIIPNFHFEEVWKEGRQKHLGRPTATISIAWN